MLDERKHARYRSVIYLKVFERQRKELIGHLVDVSERGLMLVTEQPLETGEHLKLEFTPPSDWQQQAPVAFDAEVRWCRPEANPELFDIGLLVIGPSPEFNHAIEQLTAGYVFTSTE